MVMRASQVIPVYPLTEDLQPGDVFLVQLPIDQQQKLYQAKGFLPLDNLLQRLQPTGYAAFYKKSFEVGTKEKELPRFWLEPGKTGAWGASPDAAFPTYNFSVRRGAGFSLALPLQGVPLGISLLGADSANGSIAIQDAHTYGVDTVSLYDDLLKWVAKNRTLLANFESSPARRNYLRVISRVYMTGRLSITLEDAASASGSASAGAPKPVELLVPTSGTPSSQLTTEQYAKNIEGLNKMIAGILGQTQAGQAPLPGGTVKVAAASARSITLLEEFKRPLVIGYLGFDLMIGKDAELGPPLPTYAVLSEGQQPAGFTRVQSDIRRSLQEIDSSKDPEAVRIRIAGDVGGEVETLYNMYCQRENSLAARGDFFRMLTALYLSDESGDGPRHQTFKRSLEKALQEAR
jgi:hypothetical protein